MTEIINLNHERLLARTLALRAARKVIVEYRDACLTFGSDKDAIKEAKAFTKLLHQIDEALK